MVLARPQSISASPISNWTAGAVRNSLTRVDRLERLSSLILRSLDLTPEELFTASNGELNKRTTPNSSETQKRLTAMEREVRALSRLDGAVHRLATVEERTRTLEEKVKSSSAILTELMRYHRVGAKIPIQEPPSSGAGLAAPGEGLPSSAPGLATAPMGGVAFETGATGEDAAHYSDGILRHETGMIFAIESRLASLEETLATNVSASIACGEDLRKVQSDMATQLKEMETRFLQVEGRKELPPELLGVIAQLPQALATTATVQQQLMEVTRHHTGELAALQTRIPDDVSIERLLGMIETVVFRVKVNEDAIAENKAAVSDIGSVLASFPTPEKLRLCEVATASIHLMSAELGDFRRALHQLRQRPPPT